MGELQVITTSELRAPPETVWGCVASLEGTDRVAFLPRVRAAHRLHRAVVAAIFRHRHRRLRAYFGAG